MRHVAPCACGALRSHCALCAPARVLALSVASDLTQAPEALDIHRALIERREEWRAHTCPSPGRRCHQGARYGPTQDCSGGVGSPRRAVSYDRNVGVLLEGLVQRVQTQRFGRRVNVRGCPAPRARAAQEGSACARRAAAGAVALTGKCTGLGAPARFESFCGRRHMPLG